MLFFRRCSKTVILLRSEPAQTWGGFAPIQVNSTEGLLSDVPERSSSYPCPDRDEKLPFASGSVRLTGVDR
jgi:hypothetical protein